jgi:hypothetical protein
LGFEPMRRTELEESVVQVRGLKDGTRY